MLRYKSDYWMDLVLRMLEAEMLLRHNRPMDDNIKLILAPDIQAMLSRFWLLGTYKALRMAKNTAQGKAEKASPTLLEVFISPHSIGKVGSCGGRQDKKSFVL